MAYRLYTQAMQTVREIEQRQVAPLVAQGERADGSGWTASCVDVKEVTRA